MVEITSTAHHWQKISLASLKDIILEAHLIINNFFPNGKAIHIETSAGKDDTLKDDGYSIGRVHNSELGAQNFLPTNMLLGRSKQQIEGVHEHKTKQVHIILMTASLNECHVFEMFCFL